MLPQILIGSGLLVITTIIHAGGMSLGLRWLARAYSNPRLSASFVGRSLMIAVLILIMFAVTLAEVIVWAGTYLMLGANSDLEEALYFSTVTYTTLGYGDLVLESHWRLLSAFQAANGIIMFSWTTAIIVVALNRVSRQLGRVRRLKETWPES